MKNTYLYAVQYIPTGKYIRGGRKYSAKPIYYSGMGPAKLAISYRLKAKYGPQRTVFNEEVPNQPENDPRNYRIVRFVIKEYDATRYIPDYIDLTVFNKGA